MKRLIVYGGRGFVGRNLARHLKPHFDEVIDWWRYSPKLAQDILSTDTVINCIGWKNVPQCEKDPALAYELNAIAPARLAWDCHRVGCKFIHISSDHAYATPETIYGKSKRLGDELVARENPDALIVVTGHVYDVDCPWVVWLDGELRARREIRAWSDIWNRPTYAADVAKAIMEFSGKESGIKAIVGATKQNRYYLFSAYATVNGYDKDLIIPVDNEAPWYYPRKYEYIARPPYYGRNTFGGFGDMRSQLGAVQ